MHDNDLVTLTSVAAEINTTADKLAVNFGDSVVHDNAGRRCITAERSRMYLAAPRSAAAAEKERRQREFDEAARRPHPVRERVRRLVAAQAAAGCADPDVPALARMKAHDADDPFNRSSRALDEMLSGSMQYHRVKKD